MTAKPVLSRLKKFNSCIAAALVLTLGACSDEPYPLEQFQVPAKVLAKASQDCSQQYPKRRAYFGDTHVHTSISSDAWLFDVRLRPDDAYRYGFGEPVLLPNSNGKPPREVRIDRPLDFVAVTDHAEFLGESWLCSTPGSSIYEEEYCLDYRQGRGRSMQLAKHIFSPVGFRADAACGKDGQRCRDAAKTQWQEIIEAAENWNDRSSDCERTAFIAYEYSSHRLGSNLHRNVIFRNNAVPALPISYIEAPEEWELWKRLKQDCKDSSSGCDVLAIPHNSNISNGRMFNLDYAGTGNTQEQAQRAALRAEIEPLIEIMQHKGDSECRNGIAGVLNSEDELCSYEKFEDFALLSRFNDSLADVKECGDGKLAHYTPHLGPDCISKLSYARYALIEGLKEQQRHGVNPFKFGISAATDTHNALAGGVEERSFPGHLGTGDESASKRATWSAEVEGNASNSPGGLTGVWATQNNRDSLFDAMQRKEVFGTSGPRIQPRLFASWDYPDNLCQRADALDIAYAKGVSMGQDLPKRGDAKAPRFFVQAAADAGTANAPGTPLQRLQIIKGWVNKAGESVQKIYEVAGDPDNGASVDLQSCATQGAGFQQLCTVWQDPDFDASLHAVYYLRVIENPSCRYDAWQCIGLKGEDRPADCDINTAERPKIIQERAWTSPIWYTPDKT